MNIIESVEIERIGRAISILIFSINQELYEEATERGRVLLKSILGIFPVGLFAQYPELEAVYKKLVEVEKRK